MLFGGKNDNDSSWIWIIIIIVLIILCNDGNLFGSNNNCCCDRLDCHDHDNDRRDDC